jgi:hypothetical protein
MSNFLKLSRALSYFSLRISQRGDSGISKRKIRPMMAGTAPRPKNQRQSVFAALPGKIFRMTKETRNEKRMPTVIIHCWSMASDPRRSAGAYSEM